MEFVTLIDNLVYGEVLTAEHGLSFLIKTGGKTILFDTGQTGAILKNADYLDEDLETVDYVILSHGHYDHCGGLEAFLSVNTHAKIIMKSDAIQDKFKSANQDYKAIGFHLKKSVEDYDNEFIFVDEPVEISKGLTVMTHIEQYENSFDSIESFFVKKNSHYISDPFSDELFLMIEENDKHYLFTGCSHKGILNIIKTATEFIHHEQIEFVAGGMHITSNLIDSMDQYLIEFENMKVSHFFVNHCTGIEGYIKLKAQLQDRVSYSYTGFRFESNAFETNEC